MNNPALHDLEYLANLFDFEYAVGIKFRINTSNLFLNLSLAEAMEAIPAAMGVPVPNGDVKFPAGYNASYEYFKVDVPQEQKTISFDITEQLVIMAKSIVIAAALVFCTCSASFVAWPRADPMNSGLKYQFIL